MTKVAGPHAGAVRPQAGEPETPVRGGVGSVSSRGGRRPLLLGIDLGTSSVKVLLMGLEGRVEGRGHAGYGIRRPAPGQAEQVPVEWWSAIRDAVASAVASSGDPVAARRVAAVGLDGQMHGTVLLDPAGEPVGDAVIWPDQRSGEEVAELTSALGREEIIAAVGGPLATGFQAPTVRWIQRHEPARWGRVAAICAPKDWVRLRLTGVLATDPSDGSGTGFLDARSRAWWPAILEAAGVDAAMLPTVLDAAALAGPLVAAAADELGLTPGIPVAVGGGDTPVGLLGAGLVTTEAFLVALSTGGQIAVPALEPRPDPLGRTHTFCSVLAPVPGQGREIAGWYRMAAILSAGAALRWLREDVLGIAGADSHDRSDGWATDELPGADGLLFLPYLAGERSPHMDPRARGSFVGLTSRHGRGALVRAVMEGVAFACLDAAACLGDKLPATLVLGGGGARSAVWSGIVADVFGRPVRRLRTEEQAAMGACLLGGGAAGLLDVRAAAREWAAVGEAIVPDPEREARYAGLFELFRATHRAMSSVEHRLADLGTVR